MINYSNTRNRKIIGNLRKFCKQRNTIQPSFIGKKGRSHIYRCNDGISIIDYLRGNIIADASIYNIAVKKLIELDKMECIDDVMNIGIQKDDAILDSILFNCYFDTIMKQNDAKCLDKCKHYFDIMINKIDVVPDRITFTILIKVAKKYKDVEWGKYLYELMIGYYKIKEDSKLFNEMIGLYGECNDVVSLEKMFGDHVLGSEYENDATLWGNYMNYYGKNGDIKKVKSIVKLMRQKEIGMNVVIYSIIMNAYLRAKRYNDVIMLYNTLIKKEIKPNSQILFSKYWTFVELQQNKNLTHDYIISQYNKDCTEFQIHNDKLIKNIILKSYLIESDHEITNEIIRFITQNKWYLYQYNPNEGIIQLYNNDESCLQFMLKYIFKFEIKSLKPNINMNINVYMNKYESIMFVKEKLSEWYPETHIFIDKTSIILNCTETTQL